MTQQTGIRRELEAAPLGAAGASLRQAVDWRSNEWKRANRNVRCLQRRIVEAQQLRLLYRVLRRGRLKCLSRVRRKQQARFLGEGDGSNAIPLPGNASSSDEKIRTMTVPGQTLERDKAPETRSSRQSKNETATGKSTKSVAIR